MTTLLCEAVKSGNFDLVRLLLKAKEDINSVDETLGNSPLIWAVINSQEKIARYLLKKGANRYVTNNLDRDVMYYAFARCKDIIPDILKMKRNRPNSEVVPGIADKLQTIFKKTKDSVISAIKLEEDSILETTSLETAIKEGKYLFVKKFINNGGSVNLTNEHNVTLLHLAVMYNKPTIAKLLLSNKCDVNAKDNLGNTPMHLAMYTNTTRPYANNKMVTLLLNNGGDLSLKNNIGQYAFDIALEKGNMSLVKFLAKHVENDEKVAKILLFASIKCGTCDIVKFLLEQYPILNNGVFEIGDTALHHAVKENKYDMVLLLMNYMYIDTQNEKGETSLHYAVKYNRNEILGLLLSSKANADVQNIKGETPLHYAVKSNQLIFILLLERGNVHLKTNKLQTILHIAVKKGNINFTRMILEKLYNERKGETQYGTEDAQDQAGDTALHIAVKGCSYEIADILLNYDVNKDLRNNFDESALDIAVNKNFLDIINLLSDHMFSSNDLEENLCLVCSEIPLPPKTAFECDRGHVFCNECCEAVKFCSFCESTDKAIVRNFSLDSQLNRYFITTSESRKPSMDPFESLFILSG